MRVSRLLDQYDEMEIGFTWTDSNCTIFSVLFDQNNKCKTEDAQREISQITKTIHKTQTFHIDGNML